MFSSLEYPCCHSACSRLRPCPLKPSSYSGMLFYDQNGLLGQFQGFNNSTHEYRINNIASGGTINFMIGSISRFLVANNGDIGINGSIRKNNGVFSGVFLHDGGNPQKFNVGVGFNALGAVTTGYGNTAVGAGAAQFDDPAALALLTSGSFNVAVGKSALGQNNGDRNTAIGYLSFFSSPGSENIGLGYGSGAGQTSGDRNMYLGVSVGVNKNESNTIRIGDSNCGCLPNYTRMFVAGVRGVTTGNADAVPVVIDSLGQLGTVSSSRRYKDDIQDMADASSGLMKLRPVTFRYKQPYANDSRPIDYGLIAEEVETVYPDLVAHSADGQVETVQYQKINAMLLNEVQKQHRQLEEQKGEIEALKARLNALERAKR